MSNGRLPLPHTFPYNPAVETTLLQTKFYIPSTRPSLVPRPRLIEKLNAGLWQNERFAHTLTLIAAPAGFGKTTLVTDWLTHFTIHHSPFTIHHCCWLSLDEDDNDPQRFFSYMAAALQTIPDMGQSVQGQHPSSQPIPPKSFVTAMIQDITAVSTPFLLIFDDYHLITTPAIHEALIYLLEHMPPQMHLVLTSRADPPFPLARWRVRQQVNEIREADLRFSTAEAVTFLQQVMQLDMSPANAAVLQSRTEGWAAGLQLAALSLRGLAQDTTQSDFIAEFAGDDRFVMDYLVTEVLASQDEVVAGFLLQTAVLDRFCAPLCDAILDDEHRPAAAILHTLETANLFIIPLDNKREWFRYHHLFADLLRHRLQQTRPEQIASLHQRAAAWFEQNGWVTEAMHHALAAQDMAHAAGLIKQAATAMLQRGEFATLNNWFQAIPPDVIQKRPWLAIYKAWLLRFLSQRQAIEPHLQTAEKASQPLLDDEKRLISGHIAAIRAYVARDEGHIAQSITLSQQALDILPAEDTFLRAFVLTNYAVAHFLVGDFATAEPLLRQAHRAGLAAKAVAPAVGSLHILAQLKAIQGRLNEATHLGQQAIDLATDRGWLAAASVRLALGVMGELLRERNELSEANRLLQMSLADLTVPGQIDAPMNYLTLARVQQAQGKTEAAQMWLQEAIKVRDSVQIDRFFPLIPTVAVTTARLALLAGNVSQAAQWAAASGLSPHDELRFDFELDYLTLARVLIAQQQTPAAWQLLTRMQTEAEVNGRNGRLLEIMLLQALAHQAQGDIEPALAALDQALTLTEGEGYQRLFLDEGEAMLQLLRQAAANGLKPATVRRLLAAFPSSPDTIPPNQSLVEPLSERELNLLRLVVGGHTNQEIADELFIALSTVKWHLTNVYGKLNVRNRTQAIARVQELGLL